MTTLKLEESDINEDGSIKPLNKSKDVTTIYITSQEKLTKLSRDKLPPNLTHLSLGGCKNVKSLDLPDTITHLDLSGCENLELLSISSLKLQRLVLSGCSKLKFTKELEDKLQALKEAGCVIIYSATKDADIKSEIVQLQEKNPNLYNLFKVCFEKNSIVGSGMEDFVRDIKLLFNVLKDYKHIELIERAAGQFLKDGTDINEKVRGFFQVAHLLLATSSATDNQKLEALRPLMVENVVNQFARNILASEGIEDSFAINLISNAFLKAVHEKFLDNKDLESAWSGLPRNLFPKQISESSQDIAKTASAFQEILKNPIQDLTEKFLTEKNIMAVYEMAQAVLEAPMHKNLDDFFALSPSLLEIDRKELDTIIKSTPSNNPSIQGGRKSSSQLQGGGEVGNFVS